MYNNMYNFIVNSTSLFGKIRNIQCIFPKYLSRVEGFIPFFTRGLNKPLRNEAIYGATLKGSLTKILSDSFMSPSKPRVVAHSDTNL